MRDWLTPGGWLAWAGDGLDAGGQKIERGYAVEAPRHSAERPSWSTITFAPKD